MPTTKVLSCGVGKIVIASEGGIISVTLKETSRSYAFYAP